ncbi:MAG: type II toxin-antitoxin system VapC family toxin [Chromatiales bacterium]|nr:type II toxin-antitoxin system VapC family toxin [Gammaproteobacteria bacterium]MBW6477375.1 type II toxin-antitoxin system VapC family toxin [Chromatiales bacterium]
MTEQFLLDTNILSDLLRHPHGRVATWIARVGEEAVSTSIIVASELRFGAAKSGSARLQERVEQLLATLDVLPLETPVDSHYAALRWNLTQQGCLIGPNDLLIAAHALAMNAVLVSANVGEFQRVPELRLVNWLADEPA